MSRCIRALGFNVPPDSFPDGVYWVASSYGRRPINGGFVIRKGIIIQCAPILQDRLYYWFSKAHKISD